MRLDDPMKNCSKLAAILLISGYKSNVINVKLDKNTPCIGSTG